MVKILQDEANLLIDIRQLETQGKLLNSFWMGEICKIAGYEINV